MTMMSEIHQFRWFLDPRLLCREADSVNPHPPVPELTGKLLLADPTLRDGTFHKAVILLAEHSEEEGAFGLILNQPTGQTVGDLLKDDNFSTLANVAVHLGGPVSKDHLTFAAFWEIDGKFDYAVRIAAEEAVAYIKRPGVIVRAFVGYSGWTKDQLEGELDQESWTILAPSGQLLTLPNDITLWKELMTGISPFHRILANAPDEVMAN